MNSATMKIKNDNTLMNHTNNEDDDALSLRDFQLYDQTATSSTRSSPRTSSAQELFEFFPNLPNPTATGDIVFCGKVISNPVDEIDDYKLNDDNRLQNREYLMLVGSSIRFHDRSVRSIERVLPMRSVSDPDLGSHSNGVKFSTSVKKVNVVPSKSKRRMFMCGPVNSMPEMEMSSIRERQLRRPPSRMFSVAEGGDHLTRTESGPVATRTEAGLVVKRLDATKFVTGAGTHKSRLSSVIVRSLACLRI